MNLQRKSLTTDEGAFYEQLKASTKKKKKRTTKGFQLGRVSPDISIVNDDSVRTTDYNSRYVQVIEDRPKSYDGRNAELTRPSGRLGNRPQFTDEILRPLDPSMEAYLHSLQNATMRDEMLVRAQLEQDARKAISRLPLSYLNSKSNLKSLAMQRALTTLAGTSRYRRARAMKRAWDVWNAPIQPHVLKDSHIGILVIAKALTVMMDRLLKYRFGIWAYRHSDRLQIVRDRHFGISAIVIQRWYRRKLLNRRAPMGRLAAAIRLFLHKRRAITMAIEFEITRRRALAKMYKAIVQRRIEHFAARSIQRVYRWVMLARKTRWFLTRKIFVRQLVLWIRHTFKRRLPSKLAIHRLIVHLGGFTAATRRLNKQRRAMGLLGGLEDCARTIQRSYYDYKGKRAEFMARAAQAEKLKKEELEALKVVILQRSYRAHLWNQLILAAVQNNRARRVQRGFRAYQYRSWVFDAVQLRRHRFARKIQRCVRLSSFRLKLRLRIFMRAQVAAVAKEKKIVAAMMMQRSYRSYKAYQAMMAAKKRKILIQQRQNKSALMTNILTIQRNWIQFSSPHLFPGHVIHMCEDAIRRRKWSLDWAAYSIQKSARLFLASKASQRSKKFTHCVRFIFKLAKAYLLKIAIRDRVAATKVRVFKASSKIKRTIRSHILRRIWRARFEKQRIRIAYERLINSSATKIQMFYRRKTSEYRAALRVVSRNLLEKKRIKRIAKEKWKREYKAARTLQKSFKVWCWRRRTKRRINIERRRLQELRASGRIVKFFRMVVAWSLFKAACTARHAADAAARRREVERIACNHLGWYYRRYRELASLKTRFALRRKILDNYEALRAARRQAEKNRDAALDEVRQSEENLKSTIVAAWKQGSDTQGRNYYYNYITGESRWDPPDNWKMRPADTWIRNVDDKGNVYYFNQVTNETRWLPPCSICGLDSMRWCMECSCAYCEPDYDKAHGANAPQSMATHSWSLTEYDKVRLKPGEVYCIECKRKAATKMCMTCWDPTCDACFKYIHHVGALRTHKSQPYRRAKKGWMKVKSRYEGQRDYYVNGKTGETTFDQPYELMTEQERAYYDNFQAHKTKVEEHVTYIENLQIDLEKVKLEKDTMMYDAILKARAKKRSAGGSDLIAEASASGGPAGGGLAMVSRLFTSIKPEYRDTLMNPTSRDRNKDRSDYIKTLLYEGK